MQKGAKRHAYIFYDNGWMLPPPPREVSPLLAAQMLLGSSTAQLGWALLCFGSIFFWAFAWQADFTDWRYSGFVQTTGQVLRCEKTNFSVGGSKNSSGTPVYRNFYRFTANHRLFESVSYATGTCSEAGLATVEYLPGQPEISRIAGMRRNVFGPWISLVAILPGVGLLLVTLAIRKGRSHLRLLTAGYPVEGKLVAKEPTLTRINNRTVYRMTFEYDANGTPRRTVVRTHQPERVEQSSAELLLFNPEAPDEAALFHLMPGKIVIDEEARLTVRSRAFLILPTLGILGNLWWISRR